MVSSVLGLGLSCALRLENLSVGCIGNSEKKIASTFGFCSALPLFLACRSALSPKCVLASCSLRREVMHALPVGNRWGGVVVGSCFNSGQGWEKPASFLLLPRVSKVSFTPNVLSTLCLLHICSFSLGQGRRGSGRAASGEGRQGSLSRQPQVRAGEGVMVAGLCFRLLSPHLLCGYLFSYSGRWWGSEGTPLQLWRSQLS